jgi:hypothetical protein
MAHKPHIHADWRVNVLVHGILELASLHGPQESLSLGHAALGKVRLRQLLLLLCDNSLVFTHASIVHGDEALSGLKEILVRHIWCELHVEGG